MLGSGSKIAMMNGAEARVALVLANEFGELMALTTRDFLQTASDGIVSVGKTRRKLGTRVARPYSDHEVWQGARAMAWFAVDKGVSVRAENFSAYSVVKADRALGHRVFINSDDGENPTGYVRRICSSLNYAYDDEHRLQIDSRLLEVEADPNAKSFGQSGDAGSPVFTDENELLGVLIGFRDGRTLVAPLEDLFEAEDLHVASLGSGPIDFRLAA